MHSLYTLPPLSSYLLAIKSYPDFGEMNTNLKMNKNHRNGLIELPVRCAHLHQQPNKHTRVTPASIHDLRLKRENIPPSLDIS